MVSIYFFLTCMGLGLGVILVLFSLIWRNTILKDTDCKDRERRLRDANEPLRLGMIGISVSTILLIIAFKVNL